MYYYVLMYVVTGCMLNICGKLFRINLAVFENGGNGCFRGIVDSLESAYFDLLKQVICKYNLAVFENGENACYRGIVDSMELTYFGLLK